MMEGGILGLCKTKQEHLSTLDPLVGTQERIKVQIFCPVDVYMLNSIHLHKL